MADITIEEVKQDLETAAYVERLLPPVRAPKYRSCMPDIIYTPQELIFMEKRPLKIRPTQEQMNGGLFGNGPTEFHENCCAVSMVFLGKCWLSVMIRQS